MLLLTTIWTTFIIPSSWLKSSITCLFKNKGSRSEAENYRGLSIIASNLFKDTFSYNNAYDRLIINCQFGFRANRSTTDAIFVLRNAINMSSQPLFLYLDLKAAYYWINRDMLFKILEVRLKSPILVKLLKAFYTGTSAAIKGSNIFLKTTTGCRQGAIESHIIFNIYLDFVLRCVECEVLEKFPNTGLQYSFQIPGYCSTREQRRIQGLSGIQRLRMLLYADDIVLLCTNINELSEIDKTFTRFGLKISTGKTETMAFNVDEEIKAWPSIISIGDTALKRKMVAHGFKCKNVPLEYLKQKRSKPKLATDILEPLDLDWAFVYSNNELENIIKTSSIANFCKTQHLKYIAHVTRLSNDSLQMLKFEKQLNISKDEIQRTMQNKKEFSSLLKTLNT